MNFFSSPSETALETNSTIIGDAWDYESDGISAIDMDILELQSYKMMENKCVWDKRPWFKKIVKKEREREVNSIEANDDWKGRLMTLCNHGSNVGCMITGNNIETLRDYIVCWVHILYQV